jgi:hypothetical protein
MKTDKKKKTGFRRLNKTASTGAVNRERFCGAVPLKFNPLEWQRKIRSDWE